MAIRKLLCVIFHKPVQRIFSAWKDLFYVSILIFNRPSCFQIIFKISYFSTTFHIGCIYLICYLYELTMKPYFFLISTHAATSIRLNFLKIQIEWRRTTSNDNRRIFLFSSV